MIFPPAIVKSNITNYSPMELRNKAMCGKINIGGVNITHPIGEHKRYLVVEISNIIYNLFYMNTNDIWFGWSLKLDLEPADDIVFCGRVVGDKVLVTCTTTSMYCGYGEITEKYTADYKIVADWGYSYAIVFELNGDHYFVIIDANDNSIRKVRRRVSNTLYNKTCIAIGIQKMKIITQQKSHYIKDNIVYDFPVDGAIETPVVIAGGKVYTENTSLSINTRPKEEIEKEQRLNKILTALPSDTPEWVKVMIGAFAK